MNLRKSAACRFVMMLAASALLWTSGLHAQEQKPTPEVPRPPAEVPGITPEVLVRQGVPGMPGKTAIVQRVTYEPGARRRKHYHTGQVVFYVLQGAMSVQEDARDPITLNAGDSLLIKPGTVHAHWNASTTGKLVFLEFVLLDEGQKSTVPMEQ
jgi:quercetin dioxygenase-like cupin family protein